MLAVLSSAAEVEDKVVRRTLGAPDGETTHWTGPAMAKAIGISISSVQRLWRKHGLQPHRIRQFKLSNRSARSMKGQSARPIVTLGGLLRQIRSRTPRQASGCCCNRR